MTKLHLAARYSRRTELCGYRANLAALGIEVTSRWLTAATSSPARACPPPTPVDGMLVGPFGIMGGHMQPHGHLQLVSNTVDYGMDPQAALDAPRWYCLRERRVHVEPRVPAAVRAALAERGHEVTTARAVDLVGCGQAIWRWPAAVTSREPIPALTGARSATEGPTRPPAATAPPPAPP